MARPLLAVRLGLPPAGSGSGAGRHARPISTRRDEPTPYVNRAVRAVEVDADVLSRLTPDTPITRSSPSWAGESRINRSRCRASADGLEQISRRPFDARQPNLHRQLVPARGFEPRTFGLKDRCSNQAELRRHEVDCGLRTVIGARPIPPQVPFCPVRKPDPQSFRAEGQSGDVGVAGQEPSLRRDVYPLS
jgi:hypothetical protein